MEWVARIEASLGAEGVLSERTNSENTESSTIEFCGNHTSVSLRAKQHRRAVVSTTAMEAIPRGMHHSVRSTARFANLPEPWHDACKLDLTASFCIDAVSITSPPCTADFFVRRPWQLHHRPQLSFPAASCLFKFATSVQPPGVSNHSASGAVSERATSQPNIQRAPITHRVQCQSLGWAIQPSSEVGLGPIPGHRVVWSGTKARGPARTRAQGWTTAMQSRRGPTTAGWVGRPLRTRHPCLKVSCLCLRRCVLQCNQGQKADDSPAYLCRMCHHDCHSWHPPCCLQSLA